MTLSFTCRSILIFSIIFVQYSFAEESSQPFIDSIKNELPPQEEGSFIEEVQKDLKDKENESLIEKVQSEQSKEENKTSESFIQKIKNEMKEKELGGAIQAVKDGTSELKTKRTGKITQAGGLRLGVSLSNSMVSGSKKFASIYEDKFNPDLTLYYEKYLFRSENFGSLGLLGSIGFAFYRGKGTLEFNFTNEVSGDKFGFESRTEFSFLYVPLAFGLNYRFNLLRVLRPYVSFSPTLLLYSESRNDDIDSNRGFGAGYIFSGGLAISLDWMNEDMAFDLYRSFGILKHYLTVEYVKLGSFGGLVTFDNSGIYAGLAFEF